MYLPTLRYIICPSVLESLVDENQPPARCCVPQSDPFLAQVVVCGTEGHLVAQGGDLRGRRRQETREEVLYLDVEDLNTPDSLPSFLPRLVMNVLWVVPGSLV